MDFCMTRLISFLLIIFSCSASSNTILLLGDSLSAGYNMPVEQSWPTYLQAELKERNFDYSIVNASISGDTTGNGLDRLPQLLADNQPDWLVIELGANDGLRGFHPNTITKNLRQMILLGQQAGAKVALMQIQVPPNYGKRYSQAFADIYPKLTEEYRLPLLPFFLEHVILRDEWMMDDGLHPQPEAQPWIADFVAENLALYLE
jgi:acyl-CoA thioesterase-1